MRDKMFRSFGYNPLSSVPSFIKNHKHSSIAFASVFAAAGVITSVNVQAHSVNSAKSNERTQTLITKTTISTPHTSTTAVDSNAQSTIPVSPTDSGTATNSTHLSVNGQNISVPQNGSMHQTVPASDGNGASSVNVNSASNESSSSLSVNISSNSTSTGSNYSTQSTYEDQNGGTTYSHSN